MTMLVDSREGMRIAINNPEMGFFVHLLWYLPILIISAKHDIPVDLACISQNYVSRERGPDFVRYFFVDRLAAQRSTLSEMPWRTIRSIVEVVADDDRLMGDFENAHRVFFGRYALQPWVTETLDALMPSRPHGGSRLIGVHYRGTDKKAEAPRIAYEDMLAIVDREVLASADAQIFLATDETPFLEACRARYGARLLFLRDFARSMDGHAVHRHRPYDGFLLGRDALLNCMALSRCDIVIKTPSILSGWAKIMNPALETYLVTRPFTGCTWFPDRALPSYPGTVESTAEPHG